jgi:hypothetical protein
MAKKKAIPAKYQVWIEARTKYHLSDMHIQMARELGLNPRKFGQLANERQEPWKAPLPDFIESIYFKRFGKTRPDVVKSVEQMVAEQQKKKTSRPVGGNALPQQDR